VKKVITAFLLLTLVVGTAADVEGQNNSQELTTQDRAIVFDWEFTIELCELLGYTSDFYLQLTEREALTESELKFVLAWMKDYVRLIKSADTSRFFIIGAEFPEPGDSVRANVLIYSALIP